MRYQKQFQDNKFIFNLTRLFFFFFFVLSDPPETDFTDDERSTGNKKWRKGIRRARDMNNALFASKVPGISRSSPLPYTLCLLRVLTTVLDT